MASETKQTTDHEEIRRWAEAHGAAPATVRGTSANGPDVLRLDFPGGTDEDQLEHISWEEWFDVLAQLPTEVREVLTNG